MSDFVVEPVAGKPTAETRIIVCQCGSTQFDEAKITKTAVVLSCRKCDARISVKGRVATVRAARNEVSYAVTEKVVAPDAHAETAPRSEKKKEGGEYEHFRFRVNKAQAAILRRAMEAVRLMNCRDESFRAQTWHGHAIEAIAADFLSGLAPAVTEAVNLLEETVEAEAARVAEAGRKFTKRSRSRFRNEYREKIAVKLGVLESAELTEPPHVDDSLRDSARAREEEEKTRRAEAEAEDRIGDEGRLKKAIGEIARDYRVHIGDGTKVSEFFLLAEDVGGYFLRISGDERTMNEAGVRPVVYVVVRSSVEADFMIEVSSLIEDLRIEYADIYDGIIEEATVLIEEILPNNWDRLDESERWSMPEGVDSRIGANMV